MTSSMINRCRGFGKVVPFCAGTIALAVISTSSAQSNPERIRRADQLFARAMELQAKRQPAKAVDLMRQVVAIARETSGESLDTAGALDTLGVLLTEAGNVKEACQCFERVLQIRRKKLPQDHPVIVLSLNRLGQYLADAGDPQKGRGHLEEALQMSRRVLGEDDLATATVWNNLGYAVIKLGDYAEAARCFEKSLAIKRKAGQGKTESVGTSLMNLADLYQKTGELGKARAANDQALSIMKEIHGMEHPKTATIINNLGFLSKTIGDFAAARRFYEQSLRLRRAVHPVNHPMIAQSLHNLGALLDDMGEYEEALAYYENSIDIFSITLGPNHPYIANVLSKAGELLRASGQLDEARKLCERAHAIRSASLGAKHPDTAMGLHDLGVLLADAGQYDAAKEKVERSVRVFETAMGGFHPKAPLAFSTLGTIEASLGNWESAAANMGESQRRMHYLATRMLPSLSLAEQFHFLPTATIRLHRALSLGRDRSAGPRLSPLSAEWLINGKAIVHDAFAKQSLFVQKDARLPAQHASVQELLAIRQQLARHALEAPNPRELDAYQARAAALAEREAELSRRLAQQQGTLELVTEWVSLDEVRKRLPPESAYVDLIRFAPFPFDQRAKANGSESSHYVAWVITRQQTDGVQIVDLGNADRIDALVSEVRASLANAATPDGLIAVEGEKVATRMLEEQLSRLAERIYQPLAAHLVDRRQIIFSPDSSLWLVPWNALPVDENGSLLIERSAIRFVNSGRDLVREFQPARQDAPAVIFASPNFDLSPRQVSAILPKLLKEPPAVAGAGEPAAPTGAMRLGRFVPLPGSAQEARVIQAHLTENLSVSVQLYKADEALEGVLKDVQQPSTLVLSTHGFFLEDQELDPHGHNGDARAQKAGTLPPTRPQHGLQNPFVRCGLALTGCNFPAAPPTDDGILTGLEIVSLDLRGTDLVVLSACDTGIGDVRNGEGVAGLRQAFQMAGAKSVLASLWAVPDHETAQLMRCFFEKLAPGRGKAAALRDAQLERIAARREEFGAAHPFFWAAFAITE